MLQFLLIVLLLSVSNICYSTDQRVKVDSLLDLIRNNRNIVLSKIPQICQEGIELSKENNYNQKIGEFYYYIGNYYHIIGMYDKSYIALQSAITNFEKYKNENLLAETYRLLGESNRATANFDMALAYLNKALTIFLKIHDSIGIASTYNRKAAVFYEKSMLDSIRYYVNYSNKILFEIDSNNRIISNNYNILGALYSAHDKQLAMRYYNKSLNHLQKSGENADKANILINMARLYNSENDYKNALKSAKEAYYIAEFTGVSTYKVSSAREISFSYAHLNDYRSAYEYHRIYTRLKDSIFGAKRSQQIFNIQKKYDDDKILQNKQYEDRLNFIKISILVGIIVLIFIGALLLYFRVRNQIKINMVLESKNTLIKNQADKLTAINSDKDLLFSIVAHDLKNPLNTMKLIANMLRDNYSGLSDAEKMEFIKDIISSTDSANLLLENLLLWSRAQRNLIDVYFENSNVYQLVDMVIRILKPSFNTKKIEVLNNVPPDFEFVVDANMLSTILRNIITNAIKFTEKSGIVTIDLHLDDVANTVEILITDTGTGMSPYEIENLFKPRRRFSNNGTDNEQGTGLGLLICWDFCQKMSGNIIVQSQKDKGSTFTIILPEKKV